MMVFGLAWSSFVSPARAEEPIKVVQETVTVPAGVDPQVALAAVEDISRIFELYEPAIPWVPGVTIDLEKQVVSAGTPTILALPVNGSAVGKPIVERAHVTATAATTQCASGEGRRIVLDFGESTYNIERRIDRIEIEACLEPATGNDARITATGRMYAGFKPEDPALNPMMEAIGAKAIQGAFIRQVSPIVDAVERHWQQDLPRG